jgi:hypothetical protein
VDVDHFPFQEGCFGLVDELRTFAFSLKLADKERLFCCKCFQFRITTAESLSHHQEPESPYTHMFKTIHDHPDMFMSKEKLAMPICLEIDRVTSMKISPNWLCSN